MKKSYKHGAVNIFLGKFKHEKKYDLWFSNDQLRYLMISELHRNLEVYFGQWFNAFTDIVSGIPENWLAFYVHKKGIKRLELDQPGHGAGVPQ